MATVQFGNFAIDMRDDEFYGRPELVLADQLLTEFVVVSEQVLVNTPNLVRVASFDAAGRSFVSELWGTLNLGYVNRVTVEAQDVVSDVTGSFRMSTAGILAGTVTGSSLRILATNELIGAFSGLNVAMDSSSFDTPSFDDVVLLNGNDTLSSGSGSDYLLGYAGDDLIDGGAGDDTLQGDAGNDTLLGGIGNDVLIGGEGHDMLRGGPGNDVYVIGPGDFMPPNFWIVEGDPGELLTGGGLHVIVPAPFGYPQVGLRDYRGDFVTLADTLSMSYHDPARGVQWNMVFATLGTAISEGTYSGAVGYATYPAAPVGVASFSISGNYKSYASLADATGEFTISDLAFLPHTSTWPVPVVVSLRVDFDLHPEGLGKPGIRGMLVFGGSGYPADTVVENPNEGVDTIRSALTYTLPAHVENLELTGSDGVDGFGNELANVIVGNDAANRLEGRAGNDVLRGMGGDDLLIGGEGADTMDGGVGSDTVSFAASISGVVVRLDLGWAIDGSGTTDLLSNIENVVGSAFADSLMGAIGVVNRLSGGEGDDVIFFDGLDTISGGAGTDRAVVLGADSVNLALTDIEWLWGSNAADVVNASAQTVSVTIFGLGGNDTLTGGSGDDQLYGQEGADTLIGGDGDDWLYIDSEDIAGGSIQGGAGIDRLASLDGSAVSIDLAVSTIEWVWASNFADNLDGTTQTNPLNLYAFGGADTLRGGSGNDNLYGMAGADALYGGAGSDVLYFDSDDTVVDGGGGFDFAQVLDYTGVGVSLNLGTSQIEVVFGSNQADTLDASTATWPTYMNGYNGDDVMSGGSADDNIYGGGGADTISGGGGNDFLDAGGGPEVDVLVVSGTQAEYALHYSGGVLASVQDLVGTRDGWDNVAGFELIRFTDTDQIL